MQFTLSPIAHQSIHGLYRVPLRKQRQDDTSPWEYTAFVGDNFERYYSDDTLPDILKERLAMIIASSKEVKRDIAFSQYEFYRPKTIPDGFLEIGWQAYDSFFVIVMSDEELEKLKGN